MIFLKIHTWLDGYYDKYILIIKFQYIKTMMISTILFWNKLSAHVEDFEHLFQSVNG